MNRIVLLYLFLAAPAALAQIGSAELLERELELTEQLEAISSASGSRSEGMIEPLTSLILVYEEMGNIELANAATNRLLEVIRANYGLYSLEQVPGVRQLMARAEERGNPYALWDLEQELLALATRNPEDLRTIQILTDTAERRLEILGRYDDGEFPAEIILGCYYDGSYYTPDARLRGSRPMSGV